MIDDAFALFEQLFASTAKRTFSAHCPARHRRRRQGVKQHQQGQCKRQGFAGS